MLKRHRKLHLAVFTVFLLAWTIALLSPIPKETARQTIGDDENQFYFGKALHVSGYACLACLGGTMFVLGRRWYLMLPALVLHGGAAEVAQEFVGRTARWADLGLDSIGVFLGGIVILATRQRKEFRNPGHALKATRDSSERLSP